MVTGEFVVEILRDLIAEGYSGQKLLDKFATTRAKVPAAFAKMMQDLIDQSNGVTYTLEECFSEDETD